MFFKKWREEQPVNQGIFQMKLERLVNLRKLKSYRFEAADGNVGRCEDIYFDERCFAIRYIAIGGGDWKPGRRLLLPPFTVGGIDEKKHLLFIELTLEQIKHSPPVGPGGRVSRGYEERFFRYYSWPPYWKQLPPCNSDAKAQFHRDENRLRSADEVQVVDVGARDGFLGKVEDFIIDTRYWVIRYLVIDMRYAQSDIHRILISPAWMPEVKWREDHMLVDFNSDVLQNAPQYDSTRPISLEYELELSKHFGRAAH